MNDVTQILNAIEQGHPHSAEQLLPLLPDELRRLATQRLSHEQPGQTLQATALVHEAYVHEAYLRLVDTSHVAHWNSRGHFFAAAAEALGIPRRNAERSWTYANVAPPGTFQRGIDRPVLRESRQELPDLLTGFCWLLRTVFGVDGDWSSFNDDLI